jgi:hypothetical protein
VSRILQNRPLSSQEANLTRWLLEHGSPAAARYLAELPRARVVGRCGCGCASVDFAVDGEEAPDTTGLEILADYTWADAAGRMAGIFLFARAGRLSGLEVYTLHPDAEIDRLPSPDVLAPFGGDAAT